MSSPSLLELQAVSKEYPVGKEGLLPSRQKIRAVDRISLAIRPGEVFGLVGESGCGKTTVGHIIAGLLKPTEGKILYEGINTAEMNATEQKAMREDIQIVFQDPYASLNPKHKIGWIIEEPIRIHTHLDAAERKRQVAAMLETVGLDASYANRYPHALSGGQRQRVSIAAALMLNSRLLVADEVVSALDVSIQAQILNLLKNLQKEKQLTYLFISHDLNVVQYMSDRIGVMYLGALVEYGPVNDVYNDPRHPYTRALLSAIPTLEDRPREQIRLKGEVPSLLAPPSGCPFHTRCPQVQEICRRVAPEMLNVSEDHAARCHFALDADTGGKA